MKSSIVGLSGTSKEPSALHGISLNFWLINRASGAISGPVVELDLRTLYLKDLRLVGCTVLEPDVFPNLIGYIERGEIKPVIAATYPLAEIVAAQEAFLTKRHVGKIVLTL